MSEQKELSQEEQLELFKLLSHKTLLNTRIADWKKQPNEFIALSIPEKLKKFTSGFNNSDDVLDKIITDLILRGITSIAHESISPEHIDTQIYNIFNEGTVQ